MLCEVNTAGDGVKTLVGGRVDGAGTPGCLVPDVIELGLGILSGPGGGVTGEGGTLSVLERVDGVIILDCPVPDDTAMGGGVSRGVEVGAV